MSTENIRRLGDGSLLTEDADVGLGHILNPSVYINILMLLIGLTVITVLTAKYINLGSGNIIIAISIASLKAYLVIAYFMHVKFEKKLILAFVLYPLLILGLLLGGTYADMATRSDIQITPKTPGFEAYDKK